MNILRNYQVIFGQKLTLLLSSIIHFILLVFYLWLIPIAAEGFVIPLQWKSHQASSGVSKLQVKSRILP